MTQALIVLAVLIALGALVFLALPYVADRRINAVHRKPPYTVSPRAQALHDTLFVADLHNDLLMWPRNPLTRHSRGQTDVPRLQVGGASLQVLTTVTKAPRHLNFDHNTGDSDQITLLAIAELWPPRTWSSLLERALYQAEKLQRAAAASGGRLAPVRSQAELAAALGSGRPASDGRLLAILGVEGLHALEGRIDNVDRLEKAGFRIFGLTHFFDNEVGGSAHGVSGGGLTPFGRRVVERLQERRLIVDLAHASPQVVDDVLAMAKRPVIVSHAGVQAICPGPRNLSDAHIKAVAATGGVIGIGYFKGAICELSVEKIVQSIQHVAQVAGVRHAALGSDFDGATKTVFDATGLPLVTQGLLDAGFSESDIAAVMGGNTLRLLQSELPAD